MAVNQDLKKVYSHGAVLGTGRIGGKVQVDGILVDRPIDAGSADGCRGCSVISQSEQVELFSRMVYG